MVGADISGDEFERCYRKFPQCLAHVFLAHLALPLSMRNGLLTVGARYLGIGCIILAFYAWVKALLRTTSAVVPVYHSFLLWERALETTLVEETFQMLAFVQRHRAVGNRSSLLRVGTGCTFSAQDCVVPLCFQLQERRQSQLQRVSFCRLYPRRCRMHMCYVQRSVALFVACPVCFGCFRECSKFRCAVGWPQRVHSPGQILAVSCNVDANVCNVNIE